MKLRFYPHLTQSPVFFWGLQTMGLQRLHFPSFKTEEKAWSHQQRHGLMDGESYTSEAKFGEIALWMQCMAGRTLQHSLLPGGKGECHF